MSSLLIVGTTSAKTTRFIYNILNGEFSEKFKVAIEELEVEEESYEALIETLGLILNKHL